MVMLNIGFILTFYHPLWYATSIMDQNSRITYRRDTLNSYWPDISEWPEVQPPRPLTCDHRPRRLDLRWLTHIRLIIYLLYPCVISQFYQLLLHGNRLTFFFLNISKFSTDYGNHTFVQSAYLHLSCRNQSVKSAIGSSIFFFLCIWVSWCHSAWCHDN